LRDRGDGSGEREERGGDGDTAGHGVLRIEFDVVPEDTELVESSRMRPRWLPPLVLGLLLANATGGTIAAAGVVTRVQTLSSADHDAKDVQLAVDAAGNTVFMWYLAARSTERLQARSRAGDGTLGPIQTLASGEFGALSLRDHRLMGLDANGNAIFIWPRVVGMRIGNNDWVIESRTRSSDGTLSPVQQLRTHHAFGWTPPPTEVAVEPTGRALFVFARRLADWASPTIEAVARAADGTLGERQTVRIDGYSPRVAIDATGRAVLGWTVPLPTGYFGQAETTVRFADGTLDVIRTLDGEFATSLAVNAGGTAVFGVTKSFASRPGNYILTQTQAPDGALGDSQAVAASAFGLTRAAIAALPDGGAVFGWTRWSGTEWRIQFKVRAADGTLGETRTLASYDDAPPLARHPHVDLAADPAGNVVFVWEYLDGTHSRIQTRSRAADGTLGRRRTLSADAKSAVMPRVAVDAAGNATFAWLLFDGAHWRVQTRTLSAG
jgi:hypothetical protein